MDSAVFDPIRTDEPAESHPGFEVSDLQCPHLDAAFALFASDLHLMNRAVDYYLALGADRVSAKASRMVDRSAVSDSFRRAVS